MLLVGSLQHIKSALKECCMMQFCHVNGVEASVYSFKDNRNLKLFYEIRVMNAPLRFKLLVITLRYIK